MISTTSGTWEPYRPIETILADRVPRVAPDMPLAKLDETLARIGAERALIVDGDGRALGLVTRGHGRTGSAASAMERISLMLHASVPISIAASMMADTGNPVLAVVADSHHALGIVTWREILVWLAQQAGHRMSNA